MSRGPIRFRIIAAEEGLSLRQMLPRRFDGLTTQQAGELVKAGGVYLNNVRVRIPSVRVCEGERVTVYREALAVETLDPGALEIVARGPDYAVVVKPSGVPVAATRVSARGTVSQALIHLLTREGVMRPYVGVVHGLERRASGLVLFTIRGQETRSLHAKFRSASCRRTFHARLEGEAPELLELDRPVIVSPTGGVRLAKTGSSGAPVRFRRLAVTTGPGDLVSSLMEVVLERGPSEQIRLSAEALGFPIAELRCEPTRAQERHAESAEPISTTGRGPYRGTREGDVATVLALHAGALDFTHPSSGARIQASTPAPAWARVNDPA